MKKLILISFLLAMAMTGQAQDISEKEKNEVLNEVIRKIEKIYPFPEISEKTIAGLQTQISNGVYNGYNSSEFATQVTNSLEEFSKDKHLDLIYNPDLAKALIEETESNASAFTTEEAKTEVWNNYGFKELSILDGNIGYLNLSVFFSIEYAGKITDIAMNYFSNSNALIIDLKQNGGGWDDMMVYLLGYFVDTKEAPVLNISKYTVDNTYYSSIVPTYVPGKKLTDIPIYILSSPATASAAEAFISNVKYINKNVKIVGKTTWVAENPVNHFAINENYVLQIPCWKKIYSINPNVWEGIGINPDIEVETKDAKRIAHLNALEKLIGTTNDKTAIDKFQWAIDGLNASYENINPKNIKKYSGNYDKIKIIFNKNKLYYQYGEKPSSQLIPISENYFVVEGADYFRIKFVSTDETITMKQIFTYGTEREYRKNKTKRLK